METIKWEQPGKIHFPDHSVHLWLGDLKELNQYLELFKRNLPSAELEKFMNLPIEKVRHHHIGSRGLLRLLLGAYTKQTPKAIGFKKGEHGKPFLVRTGGTKPLHFNLTHSQDVILFAISDFPNIGIDCESFEGHRIRSWSSLAKRVFTRAEQKELEALSEPQKKKAFYRVWTRKEAYSKAIGDGFQYGFQNFSVSMAENGEPQIIEDKKNPLAAEQWQLFDLPLGDSSIASLCIKKPSQTPKLSYYRLSKCSLF